MIFHQLQARSARRHAFTLVELLVAVAVLVTLIVFLAQAVSLTSQAISVNSKKLDAVEQARVFFDRLSMDLAARPRRVDLGMLFTKNGTSGSVPGTNDNLQFYSAVDGYVSPARQVSWIEYQIPTTSTASYLPAYQLERGANSTAWSSTSATAPPVYWASGSPTSFLVSTPTSKPASNVVVASGIFRMEFCFLTNTGVFTNSTTTAPTYSNVLALVVGIAVLDGQSLKLLNTINTNLIDTLSGDFQDAAEGDDPLKDWENQVATPGFATGIPVQVTQNVRLYERTFYVP